MNSGALVGKGTCLAGIVAHLVCGVRPPFPALQAAFADTRQVKTILIILACGALFGLIALLLIESLRFFERTLRRFERRPYLLAATGGVALVLLYWAAGRHLRGSRERHNQRRAGGHDARPRWRISSQDPRDFDHVGNGRQRRHRHAYFLCRCHEWRRLGAVLRDPDNVLLAAVGLVAMLAAAANTPIAAAVMAMELLPGPEGVYAALAAATAFLMVGHRSVYASQKIGLSKSAGLDVQLGGDIGDVSRASVPYPQGQSDRTRTPLRPSIELRQRNRARRLTLPRRSRFRAYRPIKWSAEKTGSRKPNASGGTGWPPDLSRQ